MFKAGDKVRFIGPASSAGMMKEFKIGDLHTVVSIRNGHEPMVNVNNSFTYAPYAYRFKLVSDKPINKEDWL